MASGGHTLSKAERLSGKKSIATLLADGKWGAYGHFRYCWLEAAASGGSDVQPAAKSRWAGPSTPNIGRLSGAPEAVPQGEPGTCIAFPIGPALETPANVTTDQPSTCPQATSCRPGRILISVPKRFFKRAVKRNLLKRRIREAYRVQKLAGVDILFQYSSAELADFATISAEVAAILARIQAARETVASASLRDPVRENAPAAVSPAAGAESTEL